MGSPSGVRRPVRARATQQDHRERGGSQRREDQARGTDIESAAPDVRTESVGRMPTGSGPQLDSGSAPARRGGVVCRIDYPRALHDEHCLSTPASPLHPSPGPTPRASAPSTNGWGASRHAPGPGRRPACGWPRPMPASGATSGSTRRAGTRIVMDAPPPQENVRPFVHVAGMLEAAGLQAPEIFEANLAHGFLLLGRPRQRALPGRVATLRRAATTRCAATRLMRDAIRALVQWQARADRQQPAGLRRDLPAARAGAVPRMVRAHRMRGHLERRGDSATWDSCLRRPGRERTRRNRRSRCCATTCRAT